MAVTDAFREAVFSNDAKGVRIMMKNSLLADLSFDEFNEMNKIANTMKDLYEEHDGRELNSDKSLWDDDYMNKLMVQAVNNFSHERVDLLKEVVRHLRPVSSRLKQSTSTDRFESSQNYASGHQRKSYKEQKQWDERNGRINPERGFKIAVGVAGGGVAGGGVAGGTIAGLTGGSVILGVVAGAVVVGVVVAIVTNGEK